jgi:hypothetical protein
MSLESPIRVDRVQYDRPCTGANPLSSGYSADPSAGVELPHRRLAGAGAAPAQHRLLRLRHIAHRQPQADALRRWGVPLGRTRR